MAIKKFSEFINESHKNSCVKPVEGDVYGDILFNSITESVMSAFNEGINEGVISVSNDELLLEWSIKNLFSKGANISAENAEAANDEKETYKNMMSEFSSSSSPDDLIKWALSAKKAQIREDVWELINSICDDAVDLCDKLSQKEEEVSSAITKKLADTKLAIDKFSKSVKETFVEIAKKSQNSVTDIINATKAIIAKLAEISKNAMEQVGKGIVVAAVLPFVLAYSLCKSVYSICEKLCENAKEAWPQVKEAIKAMKSSVEKWIAGQLNVIKNKLVELGSKSKKAADNVFKAVTKAYIYVVGVCGLVIDKTSTAIRDTFDKFVESAKSFSTEVKDYITDRWEKVSGWVSRTAGDFASGVKDVWDSFANKVHQVVEKTGKAIDRLKEYGNEKVSDLENWTDTKKKSFTKSIIDWAVDEWGADEVKSWI